MTSALPCEAIRFAGTEALNWLLLLKPVESVEPFHCTVDPIRKPDPLTNRLVALLPAVTGLGLRLERDTIEASTFSVKVCAAEEKALSVTRTVKLVEPSVVGVPVMVTNVHWNNSRSSREANCR